MKLEPGKIGKIVRTFVPEFILFGTRLREWYDSNPYRIFDGNEDDGNGKEIKKDVLILKRYDSCYADTKPVIVVDGCSTAIKDNKLVYQYNVTIHLDADKNYDEVTGDKLINDMILSSDGKRASISQTIIKSNLEKDYKRFTTVKEVSKKTLEDAVESYNLRIEEAILLRQSMLHLDYVYPTNNIF